MGLVEASVAAPRFGISQLVVDHKVADVFGFAVIVGGGSLVIVGSWVRSRSRSWGDWMMVVGLLPYLTLFWLIYPPILAILVMTMALIDTSRGPRSMKASVA